MANTDIKISELTQTNTVGNTDLFVLVRNPTTEPTTNTVTFSTLKTVLSSSLVADTTPANSSALTIASGTMLHDSNYLYIATANNIVKRVALSLF